MLHTLFFTLFLLVPFKIQTVALEVEQAAGAEAADTASANVDEGRGQVGCLQRGEIMETPVAYFLAPVWQFHRGDAVRTEVLVEGLHNAHIVVLAFCHHDVGEVVMSGE